MQPRRLFPWLLTSLLTVAGVAAHEAPIAGFGTVSPDAPPETAQFGFLVGAWKCSTRNMYMSFDGTLHDGPEATWTGYYILPSKRYHPFLGR